MNCRIFLIGFVVLSLVACTKSGVTHKGKSPEQIVRDFVTLSAQAKKPADKKKLEEFCSGEMRRVFERMTDESFRLSYLSNEIEIRELKILSEATADTTSKISYRVSIHNKGGTDPTTEVNEREVELIQTRGAWFLENIRPQGVDKIAFTRGMIF